MRRRRHVLTDTLTGEILDLSVLAKPPRAARHRKMRRGRMINHWAFTALVATLGMWITITK
jgi:hypothetical protein